MKEAQQFGTRIRELRIKARLSQRALASKVGIDFTYLSKIECGVLPPPSEEVISQLAGVLGANKDKLISLSGRTPSDKAQMLNNKAKLEFGAKIRELRNKAGLTQQELGSKINVSHTYLSKIENGTTSPPSKKVIPRLGRALNVDKDELLILAGKAPASTREGAGSHVLGYAKRVRESLMPLKSLPKVSILNKSWARVAISVLLVIGITTSLWFAPTAQAITISVSSGTGSLGSAYTFTVTINIEDTDLLPLRSVDINIYNADSPSTYTFTCTNLPVPGAGSTTTATQSYTGDFGTVGIYGTSGSNWGYATSTGRTGFGYGYQSGTTGTIPLPSGYGYGYGYNNYVGPAQLTYNVSWTSPPSWPTGTYNIRAIAYGNSTADKAFTNSTLGSVSLSAAAAAAAGPTGYGEEPAAPAPPWMADVSDIITEEGVFTESATAGSEDGRVELTIDEGTTGLTAEGEPLSEITVDWEPDPAAPSADVRIIGFAYDLGPDGATFDPSITIAFTYDEADIPEGVDEEDLVIEFWDEDVGEWVSLECTVDPATNTITASVSHFTAFAITAYVPPVVPAPPVPAPPVPAPPVPAPPVPAPPVPPVVVAPPPVVPAPPVVAPPPPVVPAPPSVPAPTPWWFFVITAVVTIVVVGVVIWLFEFRRV